MSFFSKRGLPVVRSADEVKVSEVECPVAAVRAEVGHVVHWFLSKRCVVLVPVCGCEDCCGRL